MAHVNSTDTLLTTDVINSGTTVSVTALVLAVVLSVACAASIVACVWALCCSTESLRNTPPVILFPASSKAKYKPKCSFDEPMFDSLDEPLYVLETVDHERDEDL